MLIKAKRHTQLLYSHLLLSPSIFTPSPSLSSLYPLPKHTFLLIFSLVSLSFIPTLTLSALHPFLPSSPYTSIPFLSFTCHPFSLYHLTSSYPLLITSPCLLSTLVSFPHLFLPFVSLTTHLLQNFHLSFHDGDVGSAIQRRVKQGLLGSSSF